MCLNYVEKKVPCYESSTSPQGNRVVLINVLQKKRETSFLQMINISWLCNKSNSRGANLESVSSVEDALEASWC